MSLVVVAHIRAQEGKESALEEALFGLVEATHREEGCLGYALHRNAEDPADFAMVERWADAEALEAHNASDHMQAVLARAPELLAGAPDIRRYEAVPAGGEKGTL